MTYRCQPKGAAPLCACGCGRPTKWNGSKNSYAKFVSGHQNIGRPSKQRREHSEPPLCACGCGLPVLTYRYRQGWVQYRNNHAPRQPHTEEAKEKMRQAALARDISGTNNPVWRGGNALTTYSHHPGRIQKKIWREISRIIKDRDGNACIICHATNHLDVHHINGDPTHTTEANLVTLCHACHMRLEFSGRATELQAMVNMLSINVSS